jgi:hypothetical protein
VLRWHDKAIEPPGDAWYYPKLGEIREPDAEAVLKEINGFRTDTGEPVGGFPQLAADGSTACGCWIYSGCFAGGVNQIRRREPGDLDTPGGWVSPLWALAWPANRRVLSHRAYEGCLLRGDLETPDSAEAAVVRDGEEGQRGRCHRQRRARCQRAARGRVDHGVGSAARRPPRC